MNTLFLAWQDKPREASQRIATRGWYPIGRLDAPADRSHYTFQYTQGALRAQRETGFQPLDAFPTMEKVYESPELFSLFRNRVPSEKRGDYAEFLNRLGLTVKKADPFEILAVSGGGRQTDNLEVFPKIHRRRDGSFQCRFFLHGWRHVNSASQERLNSLREGDRLQVALEINNPATGAAIQIQSANDYHMLGWAPRYLIADMLRALSESPGKVEATVVKLNPSPAPYNQRVLVHLDGCLPENMEPMSSPDFNGLIS